MTSLMRGMAIVAWLASAAATEEPRAEAAPAPTYLVTQILSNERLLLRNSCCAT
jgi:hypothetical protein